MQGELPGAMRRPVTRRAFVAYAAAAALAAIPLASGCDRAADAGDDPPPGPGAGPEGPSASDIASPFPTARIAIISDTHVAADFDAAMRHTRAALAAIAALDPPPDAVVINGDITNHGLTGEYDLMRSLAADAGLSFPDDFILAMGDHEQWGEIPDGMPPDYAGQRAVFLEQAGLESVYHDTFVNGEHLIVLGPDEDPRAWDAMRLSDAQLAWLDRLLAQDEGRGRRSLVFIHEPADDTVAYTFEGEQKHGSLESSGAFKEVVGKYGRAVVISAHTHSPADFRRPDPAGPLYVADSAVAYLRPDAYTGWSDEGLAYSHGLLLDAYRDRLEFHTWDFTADEGPSPDARSVAL